MTPTEHLPEEIKLLIERLRSTEVGALLTYSDIRAILGFDIRKNNKRHAFYQARDAVMREDGIRFENVIDNGYRRLPPSDFPVVDKKVRERGRRLHRNGAKIISKMVEKANDLTPDQRRQASQMQAHLGLLAHLGRERYRPMLDPAGKPPSAAEVAQALSASLEAIIKTPHTTG